MSHAFESFFDTSDEDLAAPDRSIVSISGAVKTDPGDALRPLAPLRQHRCHMGAVVLYCMTPRYSERDGVCR